MNAKHVVIGGGSGFIGTRLTKALRNRGDRVTWISRVRGEQRVTWSEIEQGCLPDCDAVVNLAGKHILDFRHRWNDAYRDEVIASRVNTTRCLVDAINRTDSPPTVFISTAGKCFYGTKEVRSDERYPELDEYSEPVALDFPAELVTQWEAAAAHLNKDRVRHVKLRIGIVLGHLKHKHFWASLKHIREDRGALPTMRLAFDLGLGATIGHGRQPFPWIHLDDMVALIIHAIDHRQLHGNYNAVAPGIVCNKDFTNAFARRTNKQVRWSIPKWMINQAVGRERSSILLEGQCVIPKRTLQSGFRFRYPDIESALTNLTQILNEELPTKVGVTQ